MFFKHKHLLEDLRKNGCRATGEILSMKTVGEDSNLRAMWAPDGDLTSSWTDCWMKLRVVPRDRLEAPFEATVLTRVHTLKFKGGSVPVWYDPDDRARLVVDYEADLEQKIDAEHARQGAEQDYDRLAHRNDQRPGLAWTPVGSELVAVEVMPRRGKGHVTATGLLMESALAAASFVRSHALDLVPDLGDDWFDRYDIHVDQPWGGAPAGAAAADGASAGLAVAAALVSLLGGRLVRTDVAVTGELTSDGELRPVAGFKEKALAAKRRYARRVVAPAGNSRDIQAIPERQRQNLEFVFASTVDEALRAALAKHRVKDYSPPA